MPINAQMAILTFRKIALGEFIPSEWLTDPLRELTQSDPEDDGKGSALGNMGVMLIFGLLLVIIIGLVILIARLNKPGSKVHTKV